MVETKEKESKIAERGSETDLVVEGYKSCGCSGGGVFVSWIEAWEKLREKGVRQEEEEREESSFRRSRD